MQPLTIPVTSDAVSDARAIIADPSRASTLTPGFRMILIAIAAHSMRHSQRIGVQA